MKRWSLSVAEDFYQLVARYVPGDTTLNQLRILTAVCAADLNDAPLGTTGLAKRTGISTSTVSRVIADAVAAGWVRETPHPTDRRRVVFRSTGYAIEQCQEFSEELYRIRERNEARIGETKHG